MPRRVEKERPRKAMILAAGFGERMSPLSRWVPKPLLPLWGRPILERRLEMLARWGVRDVVINCHHRAELIIAAVCRMDHYGVRVNLNYEPRILGTGGALAGAAGLLGDGLFWVVNGDIMVRVSPRELREALSDDCLVVLLATRGRGPRSLLLDETGYVQSLRNETITDPGAATFTGLYLATPRILQFVSQPPRYESLVTVLERAMRCGWQVRAVVPRRLQWADLGTPEAYLEAQKRVRGTVAAGAAGRRPGRCAIGMAGAVTMEGAVQVVDGARIRDSVLLPGCRIERGARVVEALVGPGTVVGGRVSGLVVAARDVLTARELGVLRRWGWQVEHTAVQVFPPRGSDRRLFKLVYRGREIMLVRYGSARRENCHLADYGRFLRSLNISVPAILWHSARDRVVFLEYVRGRDLRQLLEGTPADWRHAEGVYRRVLDQMVRLHLDGLKRLHRCRLPRNPPLDAELLRSERELFRINFAAHLRTPPKSLAAAAFRDLSRASGVLLQCPPVLVHRDFQSSNIRITADGRVVLLDFQGMRSGPAAYDLASLLCDPYVRMPAQVRVRLLEYYRTCTRTAGLDVASEVFWWAVVQRTAQALAAFGRFSRTSGLEQFARYFLPALDLLHRAAGPTGLRALAEYCLVARREIRAARLH